MRGVNKAIIVGNLGGEVDCRYTANGECVANLNVATSEQWVDKHGNKQETVEWHKCVIFGKLGEIAGKYLRKGSKVYLEGRMETQKYQKGGQDKYITKVVVRGRDGVMLMLDGKPTQNEWGGW